MKTREAHEIVNPFFKLTETEIFQKFRDERNDAIYTHAELSDHRSLFIPGHRNDRVLLVAHVDTVWNDSPKVEVGFDEEHGLYYSKTKVRGYGKKYKMPMIKGLGIGADDRAGVAAIWNFRKTGHSILLVSGEEIGCQGSIFLMGSKEMAAKIQDHHFVMQFDRNGKDDLVFYDVGTSKFEKFCAKNTGFSRANGTSTDIRFLCEKICGVNVSIGYRNEHTPNEILNLNWWMNTVERCGNFLSIQNLPKFNR